FAKGWRFITPVALRDSFKKMAYNLAFPVRFFGCLLQAKFVATLQETERFLVNLTVGLLGLFDPATKWNIPKHDEDFGQAFGAWGIHPGGYFVWPFWGSSSGRDFVGDIFDFAANLANWLFGASTFFQINNLTYNVDSIDRFLTSEFDPYA